MKEDEDKARSGMTITVLEAREEIRDIAGGGIPGRVVCAVGADAGDIAWADERGSENELEVAVSSGSYRSIGAICAGFRDMWPVLPIDQGLAATGSETEDPDVEMSQASVSELRRLVQAIAVTPATTVDEFMLKKEVVVEWVLLQIRRRGAVNSLLVVIRLRLRTMTRSRSAELPCHWLESV
jgi:hypothetical protein